MAGSTPPGGGSFPVWVVKPPETSGRRCLLASAQRPGLDCMIPPSAKMVVAVT